MRLSSESFQWGQFIERKQKALVWKKTNQNGTFSRETIQVWFDEEFLEYNLYKKRRKEFGYLDQSRVNDFKFIFDISFWLDSQSKLSLAIRSLG